MKSEQYFQINKKYENCISLGHFCSTAMAMQQEGLRCFSGPFDWCRSPELPSILEMIENDFSDYMVKENLKTLENNSKYFEDIKYGFFYPHDICIDFEQEYEEIFKKYAKRAERFIEATKKPTCFLRIISGEKEISYIKENKDYIKSIIRKGNLNNDIIFLGTESLSENFLCFDLNLVKGYEARTYGYRMMFNNSKRFKDYCTKNILSNEKIENNIKYEKENLKLKDKAALIMHRVEESKDYIVKNFQTYFPNLYNDGMYLWGGAENMEKLCLNI